MTKLEKQLKIEEDAYEFSYNKFVKELSTRISQGASSELAEGKLLITASIDLVADKLIEYFNAPLRGTQAKTRMYLQDYFDRPKDLAYLVLTVLINSISEGGRIKVASLSHKLNKTLYDNYVMLNFKKQQPKLFSYIEREFKTRGEPYVRSRKIKLGQLKARLDDYTLNKETLKVATMLIDIVIRSGCNIVEKKVSTVKKRSITTISYTDEAFKLVLQSREISSMFYKKYPILIMPPTDWEGLKGSLGYYNIDLYKGTMIKTFGKNKKLLTEYLKHKPLKRLTDVVNRIQKTSFRINKRLYDVMKKILDDNIVDYNSQFNNPYLIGGLPYNRQQQAEDYVKVEDYGDIITEGKLAGLPKDKLMYKEWYKAKEIQKEKILINMGKAITLNLAMNDATVYYNEPEIYFSYQQDFRGRLYPVQQHLNPQSKGEIKALLEFSKGYPIENDTQLYWFKIHGANCYGKDKLEYNDRVAFIDSIHEEVLNVAEDPLRFQEYWKDTDEPFLYLAWCFEYSDYVRSPSSFRSHIPIALDATCSGIQIYSGLLLDADGAKEVNVIGSDKRRDIYQKVADRVNKYIEDGDYEKTITFTKSDGTVNVCDTISEATSMKGKVNRKLTKSNVMTQPYSVTTYGMYQQLLEVLDDMEEKKDVQWVGDKWVLARLLTQLNDRAIVETVKGARVGQEFLKEVTKEVVAKGDYIFYTTPLMNFPVLQKINKHAIERVYTEVGRLTIKTATNELNAMKMVSGIAPNFIHSLDATLMYLTVEKMTDCSDFHLIHDSFAVPITHIQELNEYVRESYIELFKTNPLKRFTEQVGVGDDRVDDIMINTLDLEEVRDSKYIFS